MTYIKLLTALAGLVIMTACGGATPTADKAGGDNNTGGGNATNCATNPFAADCSADADFATARLTICMGESTSTRCDTTINPICELDFNNALCRGRAKYDEQLRCAGIPACADGMITYADWVEIVSPDATPNATARRHQFLQGTPADAPSNKGLNGGVGYTVRSGLPQPTAFIIDFENGLQRLGIEGIGGDAAGGFAFFSGDVGDVRYHHASILPNTNLGAPLTESAQGGAWGGVLQRNLNTVLAFILTVDFDKREVSSPAAGNNRFSLKGTWDERGVITGTTLEALYLDDARTMLDVGKPFNTPGILTGLIGQDGAVGVFHSNNDGIGTQPYSGGFIAVPPSLIVNYADWLEVTTPDTTRTDPLTNQFLAGADGALIVGSLDTLTLETATNGGTPFDGDSNDGYQFYSNDHSDMAVHPTNFYTGILTTTNLGAPLTQTTASGDWQGRLYAAYITGVVDSPGTPTINNEVADFAPTVNFNTKTISATITGVTKFSGNGNAPDTVSYDFTAIWDARGVFESTINRTVTMDSNGVASAGVLTGLIGQGGAVGVFISNAGAAVGYGGGFVARKAPAN